MNLSMDSYAVPRHDLQLLPNRAREARGARP